METLENPSGEGDSQSEKIRKVLELLQSKRRRWGGVLYKTLLHDLDSKIDRGEELQYRWAHYPTSEQLRYESERYLSDITEFIGVLERRLASIQGVKVIVPASHTADEALVIYLKFSRFCTYYYPYIFQSQLKMRLEELSKQVFHISNQMRSEIDSQTIDWQKAVFCYELALLLPDLIEHLLKSCDAAKLRSDIDDISDYLHTSRWV